MEKITPIISSIITMVISSLIAYKFKDLGMEHVFWITIISGTSVTIVIWIVWYILYRIKKIEEKIMALYHLTKQEDEYNFNRSAEVLSITKIEKEKTVNGLNELVNQILGYIKSKSTNKLPQLNISFNEDFRVKEQREEHEKIRRKKIIEYEEIILGKPKK